MDWLGGFLREIGVLLAESAPYLLVGFLLAGILKVLVPQRLIYRQLGDDSLRSVFLASLYGTPIPLCSCSVIPTATALRRAGASKGATTSFLISTPETGVDSISVTWALLDPVMTVVRPVAAFVTALVTGGAVNVLVRRKWDTQPESAGDGGADPGEPGGCCPSDRGASPEGGAAGSSDAEHVHEEEEDWSGRPLSERLRGGVRYAFGPLLDDLTPWFLIGFFLSGLIATLIPDGFFTEVVPNGWPAMLLMLLLGTPVYICATASTPVAAAMIAKGLDPGAALVFLLVGPATNVTTLLVVNRLLGRRVLGIYLVCIAALALAAGLLVDLLYARLGLDLSEIVARTLGKGPGPVAIAAGVVLVLLLASSARRLRLHERWGETLRRRCAPLGFDPTSRAVHGLAALAVLLAYASTAVTVVGTGEAGWVMRFGHRVRDLDAPGLYVHAPYPFDRALLLRPEEVLRQKLGFDDAPLPEGEDRWQRANERRRRLAAEAEMMTGDEALLRVAYAVHYRLTDPWAARFGVADPDAVTRAFAEAAIRRVVAGRETSELLVHARAELETRTAALLQEELAAVGSGIEIVSVNLQDVHAPPEVHTAYRDVASALEDTARMRDEAEGHRAKLVADQRADALRMLSEAEGERLTAVNRATGEAAAFASLLEAYKGEPRLYRMRRYLDALRTTLGGTRNVFVAGEGVDVEIYKGGAAWTRPPALPGDEEGDELFPELRQKYR